MAKFRVWAKSISYCYVDIEAADEEQALERAEELDGGDFRDDGLGEWEFSKDVARLDDDDDVDYPEEFWNEEE